MIPKLFSFFFSLLLIVAGCSAPHDNPLDPDSNHYVGQPPGQADLEGRVSSYHVSRNGLSDTYSVIAKLTGPDASLMDSVWVTYDGRPTIFMDRIESDIWTTVYSAGYFGSSGLESVLGNPFNFLTVDSDGNRFECGPAYMWRVIYSTPVLSLPADGDTVTAWPELAWESFSAGFPFGFRVRVDFILDYIHTTVWTSSLLTSGTLSIQIPESLEVGLYYWTVSVEDSFENSSRSKEGSFTVDTASVFLVMQP